MPDDALFDSPAPAAPPAEKLSARRRLTLRQTKALAGGSHPLSIPLGRHLPLHPDAAPADDRTAAGLRCGTCQAWQLMQYRAGRWPKCAHGDGERMNHSPSTDARKWWPACRDYQPRETDS